MEAIKKYENEVQELKRLYPGAATDEIPDTINVLTKSDLAVYDTHEGTVPSEQTRLKLED